MDVSFTSVYVCCFFFYTIRQQMQWYNIILDCRQFRQCCVWTCLHALRMNQKCLFLLFFFASSPSNATGLIGLQFMTFDHRCVYALHTKCAIFHVFFYEWTNLLLFIFREGFFACQIFFLVAENSVDVLIEHTSVHGVIRAKRIELWLMNYTINKPSMD